MHLKRCQRSIQKMACSLCDCQRLQLLSNIIGHTVSLWRKYTYLKDSDQGCSFWEAFKTFLPQATPLLPCFSMSVFVPLHIFPVHKNHGCCTQLVSDWTIPSHVRAPALVHKHFWGVSGVELTSNSSPYSKDEDYSTEGANLYLQYM